MRREIIELAELHGCTVRHCALRPDGRQLRVFLDDRHLLQVSAWIGEGGEPLLELDLLTMSGLGVLAAMVRQVAMRERVSVGL